MKSQAHREKLKRKRQQAIDTNMWLSKSRLVMDIYYSEWESLCLRGWSKYIDAKFKG